MKKLQLNIIVCLILGVLFMSCADQRISGAELLVDIDWLKANLDDVIIIDYGRNYDQFLEGHIPGAVFLDRSLFWAEVNGIPGQLPDANDLGIELGLRGIDNKSTLVFYDAGNSLWSARGFWALEVLGHKDVRILDGGLSLWQSLGNELTVAEEFRESTTFKVDYQDELVANINEVLENHSSDNYVVLDARSEGEYTGSDIRSERGGHIPGAINIDWVENNNSTGSFKDIAQLAQIYEATIDKSARVAAHCQTGVRGAHSYFVLRLLGYENVSVYDGSWAEWGNRADTPIAEGF